MRRSIPGISALALCACLLAAAGTAYAEEEVTAWRLFVADHDEPVVRVIDALDGDLLDSFPLAGPASLTRSESGDMVYAVQSEADLVTAIASGIAFHDHGDHGDIDVEPPALTGATFAGDNPIHFVEHAGHWAIFFDNEGVARVFDEHEAQEGHAETREVKAAGPHHGVAIAYGDYDLISEPKPDDPAALPIGIKVLDPSGTQVGDLAECPDLHGEAASGDLTVFACATGLLVVHAHDGKPEITHLAYGANLPEGKVTTLLGGRGLQYFLGNYGPGAVVLIDPSQADAFRLVELPTRRVHFAVDPIRARFAYVFTEDGQLRQLDVLTGELVKAIALTEPYSMDGNWNDPRPRIAVAGDSIVVTDPLAGKLHLVAAASFEKTGEIAMPGKPYNIVAVGGTGMAHDEGESHEGHDHEDHGHEDHDHEDEDA